MAVETVHGLPGRDLIPDDQQVASRGDAGNLARRRIAGQFGRLSLIPGFTPIIGVALKNRPRLVRPSTNTRPSSTSITAGSPIENVPLLPFSMLA